MNVLLGHDGSEGSWDAFHQTLERAAVAGDDVTIAIYDDTAVDATPEEIEQQVESELDAYEVDVEIRHIDGHVGGMLVEMVDSENFDRLVISGGKRSTLGKIRLGSVAEFVVLNSETPVTLVR
ncbi:universal stress protein [Halapricum hydrolyticum]|uniref:Universal stress protein n=1 Tax=Halapricum hydrolyticum TaxID=2979991 RepID=A0AAE3IB07_9EURY|nr:universal stress protein [Halapricum hydrolyticum]MCU4717634.1 universal stress protein [Halapricum hydrolyticum]MCU4726837.1 universal stress protein [Halapricum hydrolyticum]